MVEPNKELISRIKELGKNKEIVPNFFQWNKEIEKYFGQENDYICPICPDGNRVKGVGMIQEELIIHLFYRHEKYGERLVNYCWGELIKKSTQPVHNWKTGQRGIRNDRKFVLNNKTIQRIIKHGRIKIDLIKKCSDPFCPCDCK